MTSAKRQLSSDAGGAAAVEFALVAPVVIMLLIGIAQIGILFHANAGLRQAVGEGARLATIYPRPTTTTVETMIQGQRFGLTPSKITGPTVTACTVTYGVSPNLTSVPCYDITMSYNAQLDFFGNAMPPITLTETRRVFLNPT